MSRIAIPTYEPGRRSTADDTLEWKRAISNPADHPRYYVAEDGLRHAVEIAVYLRQPLLLTGEPGTGKTQLGYSVAWEFNMAPPLRFNTKSVTTARDLFYTFDTLARFRDAQLARGSDANGFDTRKYLALRPLGEAIVRAHTADQDLNWLPPDWAHLSRPVARHRSVVIVDEIDKAARDVPNDVLDEVEQFRFQIPELDNITILADPALSPILIFTSNSEKNLPDAFLRRCVYHNINFPDKAALDKIIGSRLRSAAEEKPPLVRDAVELFTKLRDPGTGIRKPPGTAELLNWIRALRALGLPDEEALVVHLAEVHNSMGVLIKSRDDLPLALNVITLWQEEAKKPGDIVSADNQRS